MNTNLVIETQKESQYKSRCYMLCQQFGKDELKSICRHYGANATMIILRRQSDFSEKDSIDQILIKHHILNPRQETFQDQVVNMYIGKNDFEGLRIELDIDPALRVNLLCNLVEDSQRVGNLYYFEAFNKEQQQTVCRRLEALQEAYGQHQKEETDTVQMKKAFAD